MSFTTNKNKSGRGTARFQQTQGHSSGGQNGTVQGSLLTHTSQNKRKRYHATSIGDENTSGFIFRHRTERDTGEPTDSLFNRELNVSTSGGGTLNFTAPCKFSQISGKPTFSDEILAKDITVHDTLTAGTLSVADLTLSTLTVDTIEASSATGVYNLFTNVNDTIQAGDSGVLFQVGDSSGGAVICENITLHTSDADTHAVFSNATGTLEFGGDGCTINAGGTGGKIVVDTIESTDTDGGSLFSNVDSLVRIGDSGVTMSVGDSPGDGNVLCLAVASLKDSTTTRNLFPNGTGDITLGGNGCTVNTGGTGGTIVVDNMDGATTSGPHSLFDNVSSGSVNIGTNSFGGATTVNLGGSSSSAVVRGIIQCDDIRPFSGTTLDLGLLGATDINIGGDGTTVNVGGLLGDLVVDNISAATTGTAVDLFTNATNAVTIGSSSAIVAVPGTFDTDAIRALSDTATIGCFSNLTTGTLQIATSKTTGIVNIGAGASSGETNIEVGGTGVTRLGNYVYAKSGTAGETAGTISGLEINGEPGNGHKMFEVRSTNATYANTLGTLHCARASTSAFNFLSCSNTTGQMFVVDGEGTCAASNKFQADDFDVSGTGVTATIADTLTTGTLNIAASSHTGDLNIGSAGSTINMGTSASTMVCPLEIQSSDPSGTLNLFQNHTGTIEFGGNNAEIYTATLGRFRSRNYDSDGPGNLLTFAGTQTTGDTSFCKNITSADLDIATSAHTGTINIGTNNSAINFSNALIRAGATFIKNADAAETAGGTVLGIEVKSNTAAGHRFLLLHNSSASSTQTMAELRNGTTGSGFTFINCINGGGSVFKVDGLGDTTANSINFGQDSLSFYEEGTWTPSIEDNSGNAFTMDIQLGQYTRIGNVVHYTCRVKWTSKSGTTATDFVTIQGLPYACGGNTNWAGACISDDNFTFTNHESVVSWMVPGNDFIRFYASETGANVSTGNVLVSHTSASLTSIFQASGTYVV
jgi:hypothetical protein